MGLTRVLGAPITASLLVGLRHRTYWSALAGTAAGVAAIGFVAFWEAMRDGPYIYEPAVLASPLSYWIGLSLAYMPLLAPLQWVPGWMVRECRRPRARVFDWVRSSDEPRRAQMLWAVAAPHAVIALVLVASVTAVLPGLAFAWTTALVAAAVGVLAALPIAAKGPQEALLDRPWHFIVYTTTTSASAALVGSAMVPSWWFASDHEISARHVVEWVDRLDSAGPALGAMWALAVVLTVPVAWLAAVVSKRLVLTSTAQARPGRGTRLPSRGG